MSRFAFALVLATLTAFAAAQLDPQPLGAQEKGKGKAKAKAKEEIDDPRTGAKEDVDRLVLAFDPGSHTRPISAMGFNKDQSKLITVGWDYSIQIWSTATGERLDILRLPAYGRDNGYDANRWNVAVVSNDGNLVAVGGGPKLLANDQTPTRLLLVDLAGRRVRRVNLPAEPTAPITALALSASSERLAIAFGGGSEKSVYVLDDVASVFGTAPAVPKLVAKGLRAIPAQLALSPSGNKLAIGEERAGLSAWDITGQSPAQWKKLFEVAEVERTQVMEWAPDDSHFARSWMAGGGPQLRI